LGVREATAEELNAQSTDDLAALEKDLQRHLRERGLA
jgi:hypothetical protein